MEQKYYCIQNYKTNIYGYVQYPDKQVPITGFAISKYEKDYNYYLFDCDLDWNVTGDTIHNSIGEPKQVAENSYNVNPSVWIEINNYPKPLTTEWVRSYSSCRDAVFINSSSIEVFYDFNGEKTPEKIKAKTIISFQGLCLVEEYNEEDKWLMG